MLSGLFDEACPKIAESQRLEPHVGTLLNLAACHERQGKVASAWVEYQKALTAARADGQPERARLAQQRADVLEPRVPWLKIATPLGTRAGELVVTLDGGTVQPAAWGKEMPVDPGPHVVGATSAGKPAFQQALDLREGEHAVATVTFGGGEPMPAESGPTKVIVDPGPGEAAKEAEKPAAAPRSRWVLEPGLFVGFMTVKTGRADFSAPGSVEVTNPTVQPTGETKSCASVGCSYSLGGQPGAVFGPNLFAGYAFSEEFTGGLRLLAGPRLDSGGGSVVVIGPSVSLRATRAWSFGAWALLGTATVGASTGTITANLPYRANQNSGRNPMTATINIGAGLGFEVAWRLAELPRGALVLTMTPFFLSGENGTAWTIPIGAAYRFQ